MFEMVLIVCLLKKYLNSLVFELLDCVVGVMMNIKFFGLVIKEFGMVEGFLVVDVVQVRRIEFIWWKVCQFRVLGI